ncbi:MAG: RHS repeat-associated core domain-containing protein [Bacteroidota bacterium]|nr:RHS repeat-associated core domain-containing protein [Bacteroidota bacterium]
MQNHIFHITNLNPPTTDKCILSCIGDTVSAKTADIVSATDYSPFGAPLAGRIYQASEYRFGYSGMEKVSEISGEGNLIDYGARIRDARIGPWLSVDPLQANYPSLSPYNYVANNPIYLIDPDGRVIAKYTKAERQAWREVRAELRKTDAGKERIKYLRKPGEVFHISITSSVLIYNYGPSTGNEIIEGVYDPNAQTDRFSDGKMHSNIIISKGTWLLKDNINCKTGTDINLVDRTDPIQVRDANALINNEIATGNYSFVNVLQDVYQQQNVSLNNILLRSSPNAGIIDSKNQWTNAPAYNWNSILEKGTKPLSNETMAEFLARVMVHEGTHPETLKEVFNKLSDKDKAIWDNDKTRFETRSYQNEMKQIQDQIDNRKDKK